MASEAQDANTNLFLYVEGREKRPTAKYPIRIAQEGVKKWYADYAKMIQSEFPEVNDEMYEVLKGINWSITYFLTDHANIIFSEYLKRHFRHIRNWKNS